MTASIQSDAQQTDPLIENTANQIFKQHCSFETTSALEQGQWSESLWQALQQSGLTSIDFPEALNGSGAQSLDAFNVIRLAGYHAAPTPIADHYIASKIYQSLHIELPDDPVTVIPPSQAKHLKTTQNNDDLILDGLIKRIPWARCASTLLIPMEIQNQTSIIFLSRSDLTLLEHCNIAGEPSDQIHFDNFKVSAQQIKTCVLTSQQLTQIGALTRSALCWGALEKLLELSVNHAIERTQFGRPIAKFQAIQQDLAELAGEVASTAVTVDHAIRGFEQSPEEGSYIAAAKVRAGETAGLAATIAHQIHGAMGFTNEHPLHHLSRRLWAWRDEYGSEAYWSDYLGKSLTQSPQLSLWQWTTQQ
ncbi:MAG: hypothetical protein COB51_09435 [Moraxellaceae bacterium]|nr:MAG: hypothetical protein COB51_09435 [Moraxellaceae bacterium]